MILGMLIRRLSTFVLELDWNAGCGRPNYQVGNHQMLIRALIGSRGTFGIVVLVGSYVVAADPTNSSKAQGNASL